MPWTETDVDEMWERWKSFFVQVLNKHAILILKPIQNIQTINDILGRNNNQSTIYEMKYSGKPATATEELKEIFNKYCTNMGPKLAQTMERYSDWNFGDFINKRASCS